MFKQFSFFFNTYFLSEKSFLSYTKLSHQLTWTLLFGFFGMALQRYINTRILLIWEQTYSREIFPGIHKRVWRKELSFCPSADACLISAALLSLFFFARSSFSANASIVQQRGCIFVAFHLKFASLCFRRTMREEHFFPRNSLLQKSFLSLLFILCSLADAAQCVLRACVRACVRAITLNYWERKRRSFPLSLSPSLEWVACRIERKYEQECALLFSLSLRRALSSPGFYSAITTRHFTMFCMIGVGSRLYCCKTAILLLIHSCGQSILSMHFPC